MEQVVLVDENNQEIGLADKATVHTKKTPLHRGFSLWLFNSKKELLLTQRAWNKLTFPGVWTNTLCGHPGAAESVIVAARRRLKDELRMTRSEIATPDKYQDKNYESIEIKEVAPYEYRFTDKNGIVENEICPILVGHSDEEPKPNPEEIADWKWIPWQEFLDNIKENPRQYSPWSREEAKILSKII